MGREKGARDWRRYWSVSNKALRGEKNSYYKGTGKIIRGMMKR